MFFYVVLSCLRKIQSITEVSFQKWWVSFATKNNKYFSLEHKLKLPTDYLFFEGNVKIDFDKVLIRLLFEIEINFESFIMFHLESKKHELTRIYKRYCGVKETLQMLLKLCDWDLRWKIFVWFFLPQLKKESTFPLLITQTKKQKFVLLKENFQRLRALKEENTRISDEAKITKARSWRNSKIIPQTNFLWNFICSIPSSLSRRNLLCNSITRVIERCTQTSRDYLTI